MPLSVHFEGPDTVFESRARRDRWLIFAFAAISLIAMIAGSLGLHKAEQHLLEVEAVAAARNWTETLQTHLPNLQELVADGTLSDADRRVLQLASDASGVLRYEAPHLEGDATIGPKSDGTLPSYSQADAAASPTIRFVDDGSFGPGVKVVGEAYTTVFDGEAPVGAVKVYVDMTERAHEHAHIGHYVLAGLGALLIAIGSVVGFFVRRSNRDRNDELRQVLESHSRLEETEQELAKLTHDLECANADLYAVIENINCAVVFMESDLHASSVYRVF